MSRTLSTTTALPEILICEIQNVQLRVRKWTVRLGEVSVACYIMNTFTTNTIVSGVILFILFYLNDLVGDTRQPDISGETLRRCERFMIYETLADYSV